ncbi:hypothetical protein [Streptomyces nigrescens]
MEASLNVLLAPSAENSAFMRSRGAHSPRMSCWTAPKDTLASIVSELEERGTQFYRLYAFTPDESDPPEEYGAHLSLFREDEKTPAEGTPALLKSEDESAHVATLPLLDVLSPLTHGVEWQERENGSLWELAHAPQLPDPVSLPATYGLDQGSTGLWMISHDGRMVLTKKNLAFLNTHGMAWVDSYEANGERYPISPMLTYGGRVLESLSSSGVELRDQPIYLVNSTTSDSVENVGNGRQQ